MPTTRLKIGLDALANGNREKFGEIFREFRTNIKQGNQKYRENNVLIFGPLYEIDTAVGNFGSFRATLHYPVLTTAKANREVMLPKKDGTLVEEVCELKNADEAQELTRQSIYEVARKIMTRGLGRSLNEAINKKS